MIVNLLRENPLSFKTHMQTYCNQGKKSGDVQKIFKNTEKKLSKLEKLEPVELDKNAAVACYVNLTKNEKSPDLLQDGAKKELEQQKKVKAGMHYSAYLKKNWTGSPLELVCDMILKFYETDSN